MLKILRNIFLFFVAIGVLGIIVAVMYAKRLEKEYNLTDQDLDGALWTMPARVYARPLELFKGAQISSKDLVRELELLKFSPASTLEHTGQYVVGEESVQYFAPEFLFWDGKRPPRRIEVLFKDGAVEQIKDLDSNTLLVLERVNPSRIASIYPQKQQDRILVSLKDVPQVLVDALIATEDRNFWSHFGVDPRGLTRSIYMTFISKQDQQGGSTLTQQFIKNHYLTKEKRISRKIKEMLMAVTLERYASKEKILEGYLNEIYLGQDGSRAIHGFGLASEYFFGKPLKALSLHQVALLVALVREPSSADPRKHPEYATKRRNLILSVMCEQGLISEQDRALASALPLDVVGKERSAERVMFPAFVDLVYQQLAQNYSKEDLTAQGLNIFTTLNPLYQMDVQNAVTEEVAKLEKSRKQKEGFLQGAAVVVDSQTAEVVAIVGSRVAGEQGFNRALSAQRQIGSLVKPAVYLAALEYPSRFALSTALDDSPADFVINGKKWSPKNYDHKNRENVSLIDGLVYSYNIPTVRLAMDVGIQDVASTLKRLGAWTQIPAYPSLALGAVQMTPFEVAQIYETFASDGYYQPLRSIREIMTNEGKVVKRYSISSIRAIDERPYYLILTAMQQVVSRGTAGRAAAAFKKPYYFAGKTGTTDEYRDSWFAGFSGNFLTVAWLGNDQNKPTRFSGSNGGLPLWVSVMKQLPLKPLQIKKPEGIGMQEVVKKTGGLPGLGCDGEKRISVPVIEGYEQEEVIDCISPEDLDMDIYDNPADYLQLESTQGSGMGVPQAPAPSPNTNSGGERGANGTRPFWL